MAIRRHDYTGFTDQKFICYTGMETDLIFTQKVDLPEFAAFPLLRTQAGRKLIDGYYQRIIELAVQKNLGVMLDSVTWAASPERAKHLGYNEVDLLEINQDAVEIMQRARDAYGDLPTLLNANIGPRADAYSAIDRMTVAEAQSYHGAQINVIGGTAADLITAYTLGYVEEAIGMALAAQRVKIPIVISFTVETDGQLPSGMSVMEAVKMVDEYSHAYPTHYMINCAHPEHFEHILTALMPTGRLRGLVVNASKCNHAELDDAIILDDGDPNDLGLRMRKLQQKYKQLTVIGGCCGTDLRHLNEMFE